MRSIILLSAVILSMSSEAQTSEHLDDSSTSYTCGDTTFNQISDAIKHFEGILNVDSTNEVAHYSLGMSHYKLREYETAIRYFNALTEIDSCYPNTIVNIGFCYYFLGQKDKACEVWKSNYDCPAQAAALLMLIEEYCKPDNE
ncbi:tetratricopeptide repeat protein [bacterium]|nr:tetratricopeptide repeat protein [bacterium]